MPACQIVVPDDGPLATSDQQWLVPEKLRSQPRDQRTDLFLAGVSIYLAATGTFPFDDESVHRVNRPDQAPTPPATINPEIPQRLSDLIMSLLASEPSARPTPTAALAELAMIDTETR